MSRCRLGRMEGDAVRVVGELAGPACLVLARTDYDVCTVEVPVRIPVAEIEAAVRFRLREVYPGQDQATHLDLCVRRGREALRVTACVVSARVMERYRAAAGRDPVVPAHRLLRPSRRPKRVLLVGPDWGELIVMEPGMPTASRLIHAGPRELPSAVADETPGGLALLGDAEHLSAFADSLETGVATPRARLRRRAWPPPFSAPRTPGGAYRLALDAALLAGLVASAVYASQNALAVRSREAARIAAELRSLDSVTEEYQRLREFLRAQPTRSEAPDPRTVVALLSELARVLPTDTAMTQMTWEAPLFRVEASSAQPLRIPGLLSARPGFRDIEVESVVKLPEGSGFRFVLRGRYR